MWRDTASTAPHEFNWNGRKLQGRAECVTVMSVGDRESEADMYTEKDRETRKETRTNIRSKRRETEKKRVKLRKTLEITRRDKKFLFVCLFVLVVAAAK